MRLILCVLALMMLVIPACGQETEEEYLDEGVALAMQGKYDEAIQAFDEAIRLDPEDALAWNNKGVALAMQGKYDEAIQAYDETIRLYPEYADVWYYKGLALAVQGEYDEACFPHQPSNP